MDVKHSTGRALRSADHGRKKNTNFLRVYLSHWEQIVRIMDVKIVAGKGSEGY